MNAALIWMDIKVPYGTTDLKSALIIPSIFTSNAAIILSYYAALEI